MFIFDGIHQTNYGKLQISFTQYTHLWFGNRQYQRSLTPSIKWKWSLLKKFSYINFFYCTYEYIQRSKNAKFSSLLNFRWYSNEVTKQLYQRLGIYFLLYISVWRMNEKLTLCYAQFSFYQFRLKSALEKRIPAAFQHCSNRF